MVVSSISLRKKLSRSSWHLFRLAYRQCGRTGSDAVLGQQLKGAVAWFVNLTMDHDLLLLRLERQYGLHGVVL